MDIFLSKVTQQAMNYAIRSGITITSGYAIRQCARLLKSTEKGSDKDELAGLQLRLESKIRIISPAIDMIELIAARGNTSLESAVTLTKAIRWDIQALGTRLAKAASEEELSRRGGYQEKPKEQLFLELKLIIADIKRLLARIEDAVPLINLAITTSGVSLSTNLPSTVSPSRLLQASTFLTAGDSRYAMAPGQAVQIGPVYTLSMYMLFAGHTHRPHNEEGIRGTTWKEAIHKARVKLLRIPLIDVYKFPGGDGYLHRASNDHADKGAADPLPSEGKAYEFAYQLQIIEDLNDDRVHTFEENEPQPGPLDDVATAGIREVVPIHEISKIFYADTGKILNIGTDGETNNPVLLLKRDVNAPPPRRMMETNANEANWYDEPAEEETGQHFSDEDESAAAQLRRESSFAFEEEEPEPLPTIETSPWRLPPNLDPEWIAFEVYTEDPTSDDEEESALDSLPSPIPPPSRSRSGTPGLTNSLNDLTLQSNTPTTSSPLRSPRTDLLAAPAPPVSLPALRTSLSLLELLIRLTSLQQFQQSSHLSITDELLNFFLSDSSTTGAGSDSSLRRRVRREARMRVGFDPYDESPIKRRGEEYLAEHGHPRQWEGYEDEDASEGYTPARSPLRYSSAGYHGSREADDGPPLPRSASGLTSPRHTTASSPSPLLRKTKVNREQTPERVKFGAASPVTPAGEKGRPGVFKRESERRMNPSPLGRGYFGGDGARDSGVGSSPVS